MQAILCVVFVIFSEFTTVFSAGLPGTRDRTCRAVRPVKNLNEIRHQGPWIAYGGNLKCDGCCLTFTLILKKPGVFIVRNTTYTLSGPGKPVDHKATKIGPGCYKLENSGTVHILSTDYASYHVIYRKPGKFAVFVRSLDVLKDKCTRKKILAAFKRQSRICGVKYYPYNIEKACRKYKPTD